MEHSMASPVAPATEPAAVQQAEPGQAASPDRSDLLDDFNAAFGLAPPAPLNASPAAADPAPAAPVGDSAEPEDGDPSAAPASTPDGEEASEPKLSRRQQAEAERQAELAEERRKWEAERVRADEAERENAALKAAEQERVQGYVARVGDDAEFNRLNSKPSSDLNYEDQVKLDNWKLNRVDLDLYQRDAFNRVANYQATEAQRVSGRPGVDPEVVKTNPSFGAICEHFYDAGSKSARAELNDKIAQLEADNHALRAQRVGQARQPEAGGNSPPSGKPNPNGFDPNKSLDQEWAEAWAFPALQRQ